MLRKGLVRGGVVVAVVGITGALIATGRLNPRSTDCFASFDSRQAAETAAAERDELGFDDVQIDQRGSSWVAIFSSGESGDDANDLRESFPEFVKRQGGQLGHPRDGCLEHEALGN